MEPKTYDCNVVTTTMSLLQDVLKANIEDIEGRLYNGRGNRTRRSSLEENPDSDDDLVNVVSL